MADESDQDQSPQTLMEPTTGRPVLMAPQRQKRPKLSHNPNAGPCPFCPGAEQDTPLEVDAEGDRHFQQPAELDESYWCDVIGVWQRRIRALEQRPGVRCAFLFKNVGALAGASIVHNHSQLLGLPELPPRLQLEQTRAAAMDRCPWCATLANADDEGRMIFRAASHAVLAPTVPRLPNETWLLPLDCRDDFLTTDIASLARALHRLFCAVAQGLGISPFNLWLHRIPEGNFHWHFELQPRSSQLAGLELGGDMYINSVPPAQSAARLRGGLG
jgi:UDPglucose--hexose-1-phosphate uridylyltransferase